MKSILRLVATLGAIAGLCTTTHAHEPSPERLRVLMSFAGEILSLYTADTPLPRIIYVSDHDLQVERFGAQVALQRAGEPRDSFDHVRSMFHIDEGVLLLNKDIDYSLAENEWELVHELTHYLQFVFHRLYLDKALCDDELEAAAYRSANMWAIATGHGHVFDGFTIFARSRCDDD